MNRIVFLFIFFNFSSLRADENAELKETFKNYPLPTNEQMVSTALSLKDEVHAITEQKNNTFCIGNNDVQEKIKLNDDGNSNVVCAVVNENNDQEFQIIVGKISDDQKKDPEAPPSTSQPGFNVSYTTLNDQPLNGLFEKVKSTGDDANGYTYGSNITFASKDDWTLELGSSLRVRTYNIVIDGKTKRYLDASGEKLLQEATEHTYLRYSNKFNLSSDVKSETLQSTYYKIGFGFEHDSDQGVGAVGAIAHREYWHHLNGALENTYTNHFKDRSEVTIEAKVGKESYHPIGKLGFCTIAETGVFATTNGNFSSTGKLKATLDSGILLNRQRSSPLFAINLEAGFSTPLVKGSEPVRENDPVYNPHVKNQNAPTLENTPTAYGLAGVMLGGKYVDFRIEAIFEKNKLNDGDIIYATTLEAKY